MAASLLADLSVPVPANPPALLSALLYPNPKPLQVAFQIWMATSLLADSLAVACQAILARSTAAGELQHARKVGSILLRNIYRCIR